MKLDKQRRLKIPCALMNDVGFKPPGTIRISILEDRMILFHTLPKTEYQDVVSVDNKGRFFLSKRVMNQAGINTSAEFFVSVFKKQLIVRWKQ